MNCKTILFAVVAGVTATGAIAAVSPQKAAELKTTLTPFGAEKAGSKDGMIPAWTGGYTKVPEGYKSGQARPDFFADEKPLYTVTHSNMARYADHLTDGEKALLEKHPNFRMEIYPTHRTAAAPQWFYDETYKNATRAELTADGGVKNAYGGVPFPIPDLNKGKELIWNHRLTWLGTSWIHRFRAYLMTNGGTDRVTASGGWQTWTYPYHDPKGSLATFKNYWALGDVRITEPPSSNGEAILQHEPMNYVSMSRDIWQYLVGQRRVRRAPALQYDTPDFVVSGQGLFDEAFMLFGPVDEYNFKIVGKKELYVPYNNNRADNAPVGKLMTPHFLNPDLVRWELHRIWVVDATLKPGRRHVVPHRRYYIDEDTWQILLIDDWDAQGKLWRMAYTLTLLAPDVPVLTGQVSWGGYNLRTGDYYINEASNAEGKPLTPQYKVGPPIPAEHFTPDYLAAQQLH